jgi:hypothetical protein
MFAVYLSVSSPSSLSVEPDTDVAPETDAARVIGFTPDDQTLAAELPGKQPPLNMPISPILFSLMLALELLLLSGIPILMHSLSL